MLNIENKQSNAVLENLRCKDDGDNMFTVSLYKEECPDFSSAVYTVKIHYIPLKSTENLLKRLVSVSDVIDKINQYLTKWPSFNNEQYKVHIVLKNAIYLPLHIIDSVQREAMNIHTPEKSEREIKDEEALQNSLSKIRMIADLIDTLR